MSKGSTRRPQDEADDVVTENWRRIFGTDNKPAPAEPMEQEDGQ